MELEAIYSPAGNMITMPQPNDPTQSFTATYDGWNRLVKLAAGSTTVSEYAYDGTKRRIVQKSYTAGSLTETRHMYYTASWQSIEERLGTSPNSAEPERQFVWGLRYIDDCVLRDRDTNNDGTFDERLYSQQDANWNITAIVDETGAAQEHYAYTAYGQPMFLTPTFTDRTSSSYAWESLYCGYRYESATGVFHVRNRVYHPMVGSWVQRDPIGYAGGWNLFGYVSMRVVIGIDPFGLTDYNNCLRRASAYCAAAGEHPGNEWLKCACTVSNLICSAAASNDFSRKGQWFYCINECAFKTFLSGYKHMYPESPKIPETARKVRIELKPPTKKWRDAKNMCEAGDICGVERSLECCKAMVDAEQDGIQKCMKECGGYQKEWGHPFTTRLGEETTRYLQARLHIGIELPEFDGNFSSLADRVRYGYAACCKGLRSWFVKKP